MSVNTLGESCRFILQQISQIQKTRTFIWSLLKVLYNRFLRCRRPEHSYEYYLKPQSCCRCYQLAYHFFHVREKHVSKVFCSFNWELCRQIVNGTHQNPRPFNTRRSSTLYQMYKMLFENSNFSRCLLYYICFMITCNLYQSI